MWYAGGSIYITTKTGLSGFAEALMEDVRDMGVKVVTLYPGLVNTDLGRARGPIERKCVSIMDLVDAQVRRC